jgi:hypothetical protein
MSQVVISVYIFFVTNDTRNKNNLISLKILELFKYGGFNKVAVW